MPVPMVSSARGVTFGGFKRRVASFRVAGVALRDIQTCFVSRRKCFVWQAQHFGRVYRHFAWQTRHFRRVVLRVFANRIVRAASSGDKVEIPWRACHFVRCDEN